VVLPSSQAPRRSRPSLSVQKSGSSWGSDAPAINGMHGLMRPRPWAQVLPIQVRKSLEACLLVELAVFSRGYPRADSEVQPIQVRISGCRSLFTPYLRVKVWNLDAAGMAVLWEHHSFSIRREIGCVHFVVQITALSLSPDLKRQGVRARCNICNTPTGIYCEFES
jgi:hypothetical protein